MSAAIVSSKKQKKSKQKGDRQYNRGKGSNAKEDGISTPKFIQDPNFVENEIGFVN